MNEIKMKRTPEENRESFGSTMGLDKDGIPLDVFGSRTAKEWESYFKDISNKVVEK